MTQVRKSTDFSRLITTRSITIGFDGETRIVRVEDPKYQTLLKAIKEERWDDIPEILAPEKAIETRSDGLMRVENNQVFVKGADGDFLVPSGLNKTILHYLANELPFDPLVKFAINLSYNPSYHSVQQLFDFLEHNHFTITEDGKFIAYKGVTSDFKDCYTRTIDNSIGQVVKMPRNQVNENPNEVCSRGLHASSFDYAHSHYGFGASGVTVFVEVNPKDVVSVPIDYNNAKMRVCEYKVLGISKGEFKDHIYKATKPVEEFCDDQDDDFEEDEWEEEESSWDDEDEDYDDQEDSSEFLDS